MIRRFLTATSHIGAEERSKEGRKEGEKKGGAEIRIGQAAGTDVYKSIDSNSILKDIYIVEATRCLHSPGQSISSTASFPIVAFREKCVVWSLYSPDRCSLLEEARS